MFINLHIYWWSKHLSKLLEKKKQFYYTFYLYFRISCPKFIKTKLLDRGNNLSITFYLWSTLNRYI